MILFFIFKAVIAQQTFYPKMKVNEWTAIEAQENKTSNVDAGWAMYGNFYVVTDYKDANLKLGVSLGVAPPADNVWVDQSVYQAWI